METRLRHIAFAGIDAGTDIKLLSEIQREFPIAEFGVLTSYHWYENGNRYLNPQLMEELKGYKLNLSLHICGSAARDAAYGLWDRINKLTWSNLELFSRFQLNLAKRNDKIEVCNLPGCSRDLGLAFQEVIIQAKDANSTNLYDKSVEKWQTNRFSMLLDASGGRGIDTGIEIYPSNGKIGYAGGFNPDNVGDKLSYLLDNVNQGTFWIDMESGVRTDDWFDLDKAVSVLNTCKQVMDEHDGK